MSGNWPSPGAASSAPSPVGWSAGHDGRPGHGRGAGLNRVIAAELLPLIERFAVRASTPSESPEP